uniref:Unkown protein n=1 Tax=Riptortus pedestris TaxID=329032 RepID=R4WE13_RIPPE|nr:unkown protein [Riptortus pedestris]
MEKKKVKCSDCDKYFRDRFNSWRHYLRVHAPPKEKKNEEKAEKPKPTCSYCGHVFFKNGNLKRHSNLCKKLKPRSSPCEEYSFNDIYAFEEWKRKIETETKARFVRKSHYKLQNGSSRTKFSCHRSGFFKPQGKNVRRLKSLGSNKINAICPAKIISIVNSEGRVEVSFFSKHNGHAMELERIGLTKAERAQIAEKIAQKIPFKEILNNLKNSTDSELKRLHLLTKKDLRNIKKEFNIKNSVPYSYDNIESFLNETPDVLNNNEPVELMSKSGSLELISLEEDAIDEVLDSERDRLASCSDGPPDSDIPLQQPTFIVQVPYTLDLPDPKYTTSLTSSNTNPSIVDTLKEEMRREFELVLASIQNEEQAQNGKKWVYAFHSFVHSTNFTLSLDEYNK